MAEADFDVLILGAGSGGYACALRAAQLGLTRRPRREGQARRHLPARRLHPDQGAAARGRGRRPAPASPSSSASRATLDGIDMAGVNAYKDGVVARLFKGLTGLIKGRGITVIEGEGRLTGPHAGDRRRHVVLRQARRARLRLLLPVAARSRHRRRAGRSPPSTRCGSTGSRRRSSCSAAASSAASSPASGARFGAEVTIVEALPRLVAGRGRGVVEGARARVPQARIAFRTGTPFQSVKTTDDGVAVTVEGGDVIEAELLLVAVGRGPSTDGPRLRRAGRRDGARLRAHRRALPHQRRRRVRRRRHRPRPAAGPPRLPAGHLRRRGDRRPRPGRRSTRPASRASPTPTPRSPRSG